MTIYQEEMQRKAQHYGCITSYDEADQLLLISHKGVHLTAINPEGFMFYNSKDLTDPESREVFSHLTDDAETVREYVGLYESAPQMKPKDVQNYRKLSEYGDVVFAGMYSQKHGFMFCSWRQSDGGRYLAHGDYSPDYLSSKENFAVRAGLVDDNNFTIFKAFPNPPFLVLAGRQAFLLRIGCQNGQHQFAIAAHGMNVLLLKEDIHTQRL